MFKAADEARKLSAKSNVQDWNQATNLVITGQAGGQIMNAAKARAKEFGLRAQTVDELLDADDIDIAVNLTIPAAHYEISRRVLDAGKHVYSEKPFVLSVKEGLDLKKRAEKKGLRIGSAPDTFLGGAHQLARNLIDTGKLGKITSGTCHVMGHGMARRMMSAAVPCSLALIEARSLKARIEGLDDLISG